MNDKIAIYLRLSLADGDLKKGSKDESNSIENQRMLLHDYIGKQEDLFGEIVEYVDDGYTGTNFNRPAFQKMIVDLKQGNIKVIMVKDLSRLGRDYIGVGDYIEQIFPLMGVRFIAVNNSFDSMKLNNGTPGIEVAVSNLVNNMYSRDIAKKIRAALETNWKNGKATCTNVPFGYVWNKKGGQRWEIDPEAAPCVKKVFELALSGRNTTQIAYGMNELNLPTPGLYAKRKNLLMGSNPIIAPDSEMLWNAAIVWRILRRYEYTGALVMGRRKKIDVNTTSVRTLPEDKWIIAENAHAAIVTRDEYYQAQKAIRNVTPIQYKVGDDFALKGKICCGNCNRQLRHERQYGEMVFYCGYKRSAGKFSKCYGGYYREHSVNAKVARAIKTVFYALDVVNQGMQKKQSITVRCVDIEDLEKQAEAIRVEQIKLYESYADGVLRRDAYIEKKKILSEKLVALQDSIRTEKEEQECADELDEEIRALTKQASEKTYIGGLTNAEYAKHDRAEFVRVVQEAQSSQQTAEVKKQRTRLATAKQRVSELEVLLCKIYEDNILGKLSDSRYATLDAQYEKEQTELTAEISVLEKAIKSYEKHEKDADRFIALIGKYENFDKLTIAMLNEFIEKILVHERDRKGSIQTTQEVEIYFNFVGRFVPPAFGEVELTPEELEEIRKREERKDRLHQNYLKRKASGAQKRYEDKIKERKKAEIEAKKAAIRAEDIAKGVFVPVSSLPQREPMKGVQSA